MGLMIRKCICVFKYAYALHDNAHYRACQPKNEQQRKERPENERKYAPWLN
jgi:hypothetical protein